jgi:hypothetical protein
MRSAVPVPSRRSFIIAGFALIVIAGIIADTFKARPADAQILPQGEYVASVSATQTNSAVDFGFPAGRIIVANDGADDVYVTFVSTTSTTSKFPIHSGEAFTLNGMQTSGIGLICASGKTATVRVGAWR